MNLKKERKDTKNDHLDAQRHLPSFGPDVLVSGISRFVTKI